MQIDPNIIPANIDLEWWKSYNISCIENSAFSGCKKLKSIVILDSVTKIGDGAFERCTKLESIVIGDSVTKIGLEAFRGCENLEIYVHKDFDKQRISYLSEKIYTINEIKDRANAFNSNLQDVVIDESINIHR